MTVRRETLYKLEEVEEWPGGRVHTVIGLTLQSLDPETLINLVSYWSKPFIKIIHGLKSLHYSSSTTTNLAQQHHLLHTCTTVEYIYAFTKSFHFTRPFVL